MEYTPYGELWIEDKSDDFDKIPFRFTGKEFDEETGLYYYGARYLNPRISRWMKADPKGLDVANPNNSNYKILSGINWFNYCNNNPVLYNDPTGEFPWLFIPLIALALVQCDTRQDQKAKQQKELNRKVHEVAKTTVGEDYVYGGNDPMTTGADCSGNALYCGEEASGVALKDRTADGIAKDPNLTIPGDGSAGTLNLYDNEDDGTFDHITISNGDGTEINPAGGPENTAQNPGLIQITEEGASKGNGPVDKNVQFNAEYILGPPKPAPSKKD